MIVGLTRPITIGECRGCGRQILWIENENGRKEPFDAKPCRVLFTATPCIATDGHLPHFVTCPKAGQFKKEPS